MEKEEFLTSGVKRFDLIKLTYIGGKKPIKYTGIVDHIFLDSNTIILQQKKAERFINIERIAEIEILESVSHLLN